MSNVSSNVFEVQEIQRIPHARIRTDITPNPQNRMMDSESVRNRIKRIAKSMEKFGFLKSEYVIINSEGMLQDGHHRVEAAFLAGSDVYAKIDDEYDFKVANQAKRLGRNWNTEDSLILHANEKKGQYEEIRDFWFKYKPMMGNKILQALLAGKCNHQPEEFIDALCNGDLKITVSIADASRKADMLIEVWDIVPLEKRSATKGGKSINCHFGFALLSMFVEPMYDHERFLRKFKQAVLSRNFAIGIKRVDNQKLLEDVYNERLNEDSPKYLNLVKS